MPDDSRTATQPPGAPSDDPTAAGFTPPPAVSFAPGETLAGRYRLLRPIGEGGMGAVFLAEQLEPVRREVAVKVIQAGRRSAAVLARFEAERQALALMTHPHIARVFDGGTAPDGSPFVVMEYVPGTPVTDHARGLPAPDRLALFAQICEAVQHAHQKGVIHRDLKPSNVLVAEADGAAVPKVIDFGIAKATGGKLTDAAVETAVGSVVGTPAYMAPEQAGASPEDVDTRADVYALGVILYELLTGDTPIPRALLRATPLTEVLRMVREDDPPPPGRRAPGLPRELDWIVMRAVAKERDRRYGSAADLAADVRRFLADQPVEASPPSTLYRARKFVRRNRVPVAAAGVVLLALVGGIVGTSVGLTRARAAEQSANEALVEVSAARLAEAENARKAQAAEKARRVELGKTAALAAELTARQGKWEEAIRLYDQALAQDPADPVELKLGRLGCLLALSRFKDARAEIDALAARPDLGRHRGRVLLERAEAALYLTDYGDPRDLARQALAAGLGPADAGYARTFLADTVPDAIAHLQEAVRHDPFHRSGPQMLATLLFLAGRVAEMREVVAAIRATRPDSVALYQMEVFEAALNRDRAGLDRAAARLAERGVGERATRAVGEILMYAQDEWFHARGLPPDRFAKLMKDWLSLGPEMGKLLGDADPGSRGLADMAIFRLPLFRGMATLPLLKGMVTNPLTAVALVQPAALVELFGVAVRTNPEGSFLMLYGGALERAGRPAEAEAAYRRAIDAPAWSNHRRAGRFRLMMVQGALSVAPDTPAADRAGWREKAAANARALATSGPLPPDLAEAVAMTAANAGDHATALTIIEAALRDKPGDPELCLAKAGYESAIGSPSRAESTVLSLLGRPGLELGWTRFALLHLANDVAPAYRADGRGDQAERVYRMVIDRQRSALGPDHPDTLGGMTALAALYLTDGQTAKGLPLLWDALDGRRRALASSPIDLAGVLAQAGADLLRHGLPAEAEPVLREALTLREEHLTPADWRPANARSLLGEALARQQRYAEAEPLLLAGYEGLAATELPPVATGNLPLSVRRLADLYTAWGKPAEAAKWRAKLPPEQAPPPRLSKPG